MRSGSEWLRLLLCAAFVLSCGRDGEEASAPVVVERATPDAPRVVVSAGRVNIEAHGADALELLERLAEQARFDVVTSAILRHTVSLHLEQATVEEAIGAILGELPYGVEYRYDSADRAHTIDAVRVGPRPAATPAPSEPPEEPARLTASDPPTDAVDLDRVLAERRARDPETVDSDVLAALADSRDDVRAEAIEDLGTGGEDLETTIAFARSDPSPLVRGAAVDALGSDGRYAALSAVLEALDDRDATVVLRAIAAVEDQGDASLAPRLEPLTGHGSAEVRVRAAAALEQLR